MTSSITKMYDTVAFEILSKNITDSCWEKYPYTSGLSQQGEISFKKGKQSKELNEIPIDYIKLNIRDKLQELHPELTPTMSSVGWDLQKILNEWGINYISAIDYRCWDKSDYNPTFEAIYITKNDFQTKLIKKINAIAEKTLSGKRDRFSEREIFEERAAKKQRFFHHTDNFFD